MTLQHAYDPLLQPILWNGKEYRTSHFLHREYRANSQHGGKYQRHDNFIRVLKGLETYQNYLATGDLVFLPSYKKAMELNSSFEFSNETNGLREAFTANNSHALYLVNATIQVALCHHLDDELSKKLSVTTNTAVARELTGQGRITPEQVKRELRAYLDIGKMLNCPEHVAQQFAAKHILIDLKVDIQPLLNAATPRKPLASADLMLEPNDLAERLGLGQGNAAGHTLNTFLAQIGWQKHVNGRWMPLPAGEPYAMTNPWIRNGKTGYNLRWRVEAVHNELQRRNMLPSNTVAG